MNKKLKKQLTAIYSVPEPLHKNEFLKAHRRCEIGIGKLYLSQLEFMSPVTWIVSVVILILILKFAMGADGTALWVLSSLTPALAVTALTENHKSEIYRMDELEMSTRFSLKTVVMVRMSILGFFHSVILCLISVFISTGAIRALVYMLVPYLLTVNIGSMICRKLQGNEAVYGILVSASVISVCGFISNIKVKMLFSAETFVYWCIMLLIMTIFAGFNFARTIKEMENFYGTYN